MLPMIRDNVKKKKDNNDAGLSRWPSLSIFTATTPCWSFVRDLGMVWYCTFYFSLGSKWNHLRDSSFNPRLPLTHHGGSKPFSLTTKPSSSWHDHQRLPQHANGLREFSSSFIKSKILPNNLSIRTAVGRHVVFVLVALIRSSRILVYYSLSL